MYGVLSWMKRGGVGSRSGDVSTEACCSGGKKGGKGSFAGAFVGVELSQLKYRASFAAKSQQESKSSVCKQNEGLAR